jgi:hypothetical protein
VIEKRRNLSWKTISLVFGSVIFLAAAAWLVPSLTRQRQQTGLEPAGLETSGDVAAELRLPLPALFVFRSLAIDYLWIRADKLKEQGQFFDALHLARLICELQPNLSKVWDFQAWNMAYNISAALPTAPERWDWIYAGIKLLRDKGLMYNPQDPTIYESLSWILRHKIGGISDDYQRYYKLRFAFEMTPLLGKGDNEELSALAKSPREWSVVKSDPAIMKLVDLLRQADPNLKTEDDVLKSLLEFRINPDRFSPAFHQGIANNRGSAALSQLDLFVRARALRQEWKMDIDRMIEVNRRYGPIDFETDTHLSLDWRLPWPHAIYWAMEGLKYSGKKDFAESRLQKAVYQSLQDLFHYGHVQIFATAPPPTETRGTQGQEMFEKQFSPEIQIFLSQDLRMFPIAYQATLDIIDQFKKSAIPLSKGMEDAAINMARSGIVNLYLAGHTKPARELLGQNRRRYPEREIFHPELEEFIRNEMKEAIEDISPKDASDYIDSMLRDAYFRYALRDDENATVREKLAEQVLDRFRKDYSKEQHRLNLPEFSNMRWLALKDFMSDPQVAPPVKGFLLQRLKVENPSMYDRVIEELKKQEVIPEGSPPGAQGPAKP